MNYTLLIFKGARVESFDFSIVYIFERSNCFSNFTLSKSILGKAAYNFDLSKVVSFLNTVKNSLLNSGSYSCLSAINYGIVLSFYLELLLVFYY